MPALTHNRVKNGFNGGIRKRNASTGTVKSRTMGMGSSDGLRRSAIVGGIGSMPTHIRKAYNRRVRCNCSLEATTYPFFVNEPITYAEVGTNYNFNLNYSHNTLGRSSEYQIIEKPSWLTISSSGNTIILSGAPLLTDISTSNRLTIKLIDEKKKEITKSFDIKVYFKVYDVTVSSFGISPTLNYYILTDYGGNQINLGEIMTYDTTDKAIYRFNQTNASNINHPLRMSDQNGITNTLTSNITAFGIPGTEGAYVEFTSTNEKNYIYCLYHGFGMGGFYQPESFSVQVDTIVDTGVKKFLINNNSTLAISLNYRGAYLFNLNDSSNDTYNLVFKTTDDINGVDYNQYYTYGTSGTNGFVVLVINDNLNITIQEKTNPDYGINYNNNISITSTNQTGTISMSGVFKQDEVVTANISDADGVPADSSITYQWYIDDVVISGANSKTYTIVAVDYNKQLNVNAIYVDNSGFNENITSTKETIQDTPGTVTLVGNYQVNNSILAQLDDVDGNGVNVISSYQWVKHDLGTAISTATNITGATTFSYTPVIADIGKLINIKISYTDNNSTGYTDVVSDTSVEIIKEPNVQGSMSINGILQNGTELTAIISDKNSFRSGENIIVTWIRVANDDTETQIIQNTFAPTSVVDEVTNKYTLVSADIDNSIKVTATYTDRGGNDESIVTITSVIQEEDTTAPVITAVTQVSTPNINTTPTYIFNTTEAGTITSNYGFSTSNVAVVGDNTITFNTLSVDTYNDVWVRVVDQANNQSNQLTLASFEIIASTTNGSVTIIGTEQLDNQLTANVTDVNVADFNNVTITYQWIRNNNETLTNIGTNSVNYTLVSDDIGKKIRVNVTYTDDVGNVENITSSDTGDILDVGADITETSQIESSINPTPTYIFNSNKAGTITSNYKFISTSSAVVGVNKIRFSSLKQSTYNDIWVKVTDSNGALSNELTVNNFNVNAPDFVTDAGMSNTNDGIAYISGNCMEGEELNCVLVDNDGGSGFTFAWSRITGEKPNETSETISGATSQTYTLTNDEVGKRIQVEVSYTDGATPPNNETMKTWYSSVVTDKTGLIVDAGSGAYRVDTHGADNHPTLTLERGKTYTFAITNAGSHPLRIQTNNVAANDSNAELYNSGLSHSGGTTGASAQDKTDGTLTFVVPNDAPDTLYYRCQVHSSMVGTINIISNKLKFYYNDASLKDIVDKSTEIIEDLFIRYKKDYNIIVRVKDASEFSSTTTIAAASYQSQTLNINTTRFDTSTQGTLNDEAVTSFVTTFVHEALHIFELVANSTAYSSLLDTTNFIYTGTDGLQGYKSLLNANKSILEASPHNMTLDIDNLEGIPVENNFGTGTKLYHWEEGLQDESQYTTFNVTANGSSSYRVTEYGNTDNLILTLKRGSTYTFNINATGHPFRINTESTIGSSKEYSSGVTGNGTASGTITFVVPSNAPSTLFYNCQHHPSMAGTINIVSTVQEEESITYNNRRYPVLTNEIMTGLKASDDKYLTQMTTGALKDVGHTINDSSIWVTDVGVGMDWN